ncbi:hypothetical protein D3C87_1743030 [compost metagenome]
MPQGNGTTIGVHATIILGNAEITQHGNALAGKGLVELDDVEIGLGKAEAREELLTGGRRAHAHDTRWHAGRGAAQNAGDGGEAMPFRGGLRGDDQGRRTVIDA